MKGFWRSKTTWVAIATIAYHVFAVITGHATIEQAIQACVMALTGAGLRDALRAHAEQVALVTAAAGVQLAAHADGGEA